jgi:hypothetical protein
MRVDPGLQCPTPSQTLAPMTASPSQVPALQTVFIGYLLQPPMPSHFPSNPQLETREVVQVVASRGVPPSVRFTQLPTMPVAAQVLQPSVQAVSQQTPSTQWPLEHSALQPHAAAFAFAPAMQGAVSEPTSRVSPGFMSVRVMPSPIGPSDASGLGLPFLQPPDATSAIATAKTANRPPTIRANVIFSLGETRIPAKAPR